MPFCEGCFFGWVREAKQNSYPTFHVVYGWGQDVATSASLTRVLVRVSAFARQNHKVTPKKYAVSPWSFFKPTPKEYLKLKQPHPHAFFGAGAAGLHG